MADTIASYIANPSYAKQHGPEAAKWVRAIVNEGPKKGTIQFNAGVPILAVGAAAGGGRVMPHTPERPPEGQLGTITAHTPYPKVDIGATEDPAPAESTSPLEAFLGAAAELRDAGPGPEEEFQTAGVLTPLIKGFRAAQRGADEITRQRTGPSATPKSLVGDLDRPLVERLEAIEGAVEGIGPDRCWTRLVPLRCACPISTSL